MHKISICQKIPDTWVPIEGNKKVLIIFTLGYEMITIETKLLALISSVGDSPNLTVVNSFYPFSS